MIVALHKDAAVNKSQDARILNFGVHRDISDSLASPCCAPTQRRRVEILGFGVSSLNYRPSLTGRNPTMAEKIPVPARYIPHFKVGIELRKNVAISLTQL